MTRAADGGSPGWTRTNNPPVNSRMLCQLSYRGSCAAQASKRARAPGNRPRDHRSARRQHAELVAGGVEELHAARVARPGLGAGRPEGEQSLDLGVLVAVG